MPTSFSLIQNASDTGNGEALVFFLFDLLHLDGEALGPKPVKERKERLRTLLSGAIPPLQYSDHQIGRGRAFYEQACELKLEGIISKRAEAPYAPGNRGLWLKVKCLNREEFVVVGWTDPEGARPFIGALLLGYYDPDGRLIYAGRAGTGVGHEQSPLLTRAEYTSLEWNSYRRCLFHEGLATDLLSGKQDEKSASIRMRECRRMRDEGRA